MKVLKLSAQGLPQAWISLELAVLHYAAEDVRWETGARIATFHGGHNAVTGAQSIIHVNSIIGTRGVPSINPFELKPGLTNSKLFVRDRNVCAYCGGHFHEEGLTREHIIPQAQKGADSWMNVVTACKLSPPKKLLLYRVSECVRGKYVKNSAKFTGCTNQLGSPVRFGRNRSSAQALARGCP